MSNATIVSTIDHGTRYVSATDVAVSELVWSDGGRSFEVHTLGGLDLTQGGCFDELPTNDQIAALLPPVWTCPCGRMFSEADADMIVDHDCTVQ